MISSGRGGIWGGCDTHTHPRHMSLGSSQQHGSMKDGGRVPLLAGIVFSFQEIIINIREIRLQQETQLRWKLEEREKRNVSSLKTHFVRVYVNEMFSVC